jgi:tetratricopeptide (TPR) repeat protein
MGFWSRLGKLGKQQKAEERSAADQQPPPPVGAAGSAELKKQGNALLARGDLQGAGLRYRAATLADPHDAAAFVNLGYVLCEQQDFREARLALEQALVLDPSQFDAHFMLATLAQDQGDMALAASHLREVLRLRPDFDFMTQASYEDQYDKTVERYKAILEIDPHNAPAHWGLGFASLLLGDYERGWTEWEWRSRVNHGAYDRHFAQPLWLGAEPVAGKTVLLHFEYGYGDTLQFCRYAADVAALGARVVMQVQRGLGDLLSGLAPGVLIVEEGEPLPAFDLHCPLMSLPLALGLHTREIMTAPGPYLRAAPERVEHWRKRMDSPAMPAPRIGIVCSGNPAHRRDQQRSIPMGHFLHALPDGMKAVCLQPDLRETDAAALEADGRVSFPGRELADFADTAALISTLDLVISVDTSTAHLAGALGKPVWILLPHAPDWRWLLQREDSPWYPGARLFRQEKPDDWSAPLDRVRQALSQMQMHEHSTTPQ